MPGRPVVHVLAVPPPALAADIAATYRDVLADPALARVPAEALHLTLWSALGHPEVSVERLAAALRRRLDGHPAVSTQVMTPVCNADGVGLDVHSVLGDPRDGIDAGLDGLRNAVTQAARATTTAAGAAEVEAREPLAGWPPVDLPPWRPHLAVAYSHQQTHWDVTGIYHLRAGWSWLVDRVHLVHEHQQPDRGYYTFEVAEVVHLTSG